MMVTTFILKITSHSKSLAFGGWETSDEMWDSSDRAETTGIGNAAERSTENVRALSNVKRLVSLLGIMNSHPHSVPRDAEFMAPGRLHEEQCWMGLRTALPKNSSMFRECLSHLCIKASLDSSSQQPRCSSCDSPPFSPHSSPAVRSDQINACILKS